MTFRGTSFCTQGNKPASQCYFFSCFLNDLTCLILIAFHISQETGMWWLWFLAQRIPWSCIYSNSSALIALNIFSYSSLVLSISYDYFLTGSSTHITKCNCVCICVCMCLIVKGPFITTILCSCWSSTIAFNNHEICAEICAEILKSKVQCQDN